jgi:hypothetical protein
VAANVDLRDLQASVYCLAHSQFEFIARSHQVLRVNATDDVTSRTHQRHVFVFVGQGRGVYDGFDIRVHQPDRMTRYAIVNNATLKRKGDDVTFINPQLGGIWAQDQFKKEFHVALAHKVTRWYLPVQRPVGVLCASYTDSAVDN